MSFEKSNGHSPVSQDFIWLGEYYDNTFLSEFDYNTKEKKDFYSLNKSKLTKFGLIGQGMKLSFDVIDGSYDLNGMVLNISYKVSDREYHLTGINTNGLFNDVITYKDAYTDADIRNPNDKYVSHVHQHNVGYKKKYVFDDGVEFNFQTIVCLPYNSPAYMEIKLVSNTDLDGEVYMKRAGRMIENIDAPLSKEFAGVLQWTIN